MCDYGPRQTLRQRLYGYQISNWTLQEHDNTHVDKEQCNPAKMVIIARDAIETVSVRISDIVKDAMPHKVMIQP
jgi:hypothetical protein